MITFGTIQRQHHSEVHGFPIIRIHPGGLDIIVYNPEFDLLLISYLGWTRKVALILWIVEHYKIFPIKLETMQDHKQFSRGYVSFAKQFESLPKGPYRYGVHKGHFRSCNETYFRDTEDITVQKLKKKTNVFFKFV